jgi:hypothetical protein
MNLSFEGSQQSLNDHLLKLKLDHKVNACKQSLHDKFNQHSVDFIKKILGDQLKYPFSIDSPIHLSNFDNVYLQDSSDIKLPNNLFETYPGYKKINLFDPFQLFLICLPFFIKYQKKKETEEIQLECKIERDIRWFWILFAVLLFIGLIGSLGIKE